MASDLGGDTTSKLDRSYAQSYYKANPDVAAKAAVNPGRSIPPGVGSFAGLGSINPYEDPAFGAYMRGAGVNESNLRSEVALRQHRLSAQLQAAQPGFDEQLANGNRAISNDSESRGVFNSGRRVEDQTQFSGDVNRQRLAYGNDVSNQQSDLAYQLASGIAGMQQGTSERELAARQSIALARANAGLYQ